MCSNPINYDGQTFACRSCNDCLKSRKNDWIARCMAERAVSGEVTVLNLTYRPNKDGTEPDGSKAFKYSDVQKFLKLLRENYYSTYGKRNEIRYIIAGERGSKNDRVHWHMIIFSVRSIRCLGQWFDFYFREISGPRFNRRMDHWSLWPHGHIVVDDGNQSSISYTLKYALKDQFNVVKSKGTAREASSENHGASMFRMSKYPPLGWTYLERLIEEWGALLVVPARLDVSIPDYSGFWWPKGKAREYLLESLHLINRKCIQEKGRPCPQWNTLLLSTVSNEKDWEILAYGPEEQQEELTEEEKRCLQRQQNKSFSAYLRLSTEATEGAQIKSVCGGIKPCRLCWNGASREERARYRDEYWCKYYAQYRQEGAGLQTDVDRWLLEGERVKKHYTFDEWFRRRYKKCNPLCHYFDSDDRKKVFGQ